MTSKYIRPIEHLKRFKCLMQFRFVERLSVQRLNRLKIDMRIPIQQANRRKRIMLAAIRF